MALEVLNAVAAAPPQVVAHGSAAAGVRSLAARVLGASAVPAGAQAAFEALMDALLAGGAAGWIADYVSVVCADHHAPSADPEDALLCGPSAAATWAARAAAGLRARLGALLRGEGGGERELGQLAAAAGALLQVARALPGDRWVGAGPLAYAHTLDARAWHQRPAPLHGPRSPGGMSQAACSCSATLAAPSARLAAPSPCPSPSPSPGPRPLSCRRRWSSCARRLLRWTTRWRAAAPCSTARPATRRGRCGRASSWRAVLLRLVGASSWTH